MTPTAARVIFPELPDPMTPGDLQQLFSPTQARALAQATMQSTAQARTDPADIIHSAIDAPIRNDFELPPLATLRRLAGTAHNKIHAAQWAAATDCALAATKDKRHDRQNFQSPAVHGGVVHEDATLLHHFLQMAKAQGLSCIPTGTHQHDLDWVVQALENLGQCRVDALMLEVLHNNHCPAAARIAKRPTAIARSLLQKNTINFATICLTRHNQH